MLPTLAKRTLYVLDMLEVGGNWKYYKREIQKLDHMLNWISIDRSTTITTIISWKPTAHNTIGLSHSSACRKFNANNLRVCCRFCPFSLSLIPIKFYLRNCRKIREGFTVYFCWKHKDNNNTCWNVLSPQFCAFFIFGKWVNL